ncbi:MAG TPA: glycoside hydrolase family 19 protein [Amaricoccus sp.]|uniref:glycoside hydrolase family 19 protein n=1 Tax=Amaricoccus sp. TaxID=1872485 RepID=UPI002CB075B5|nr:glycoside hydrolase family 19 protein [Amaricoccus sp.]HMR51173.1 glycoside hydrolase family 19 protein [Amaricoccus sp.]HMT98079.1 glycoside hydrolase family 19 protein [Amaricoccus sp.]
MNRAEFFDQVRSGLFGGRLSQGQVTGIEGLLAAWEIDGDGDFENFAYVLASVHHETGRRMVPVREGFAASDAEARRIVAGRRYGKPVPPHGHVYYGRGPIQLTWADNYRAAARDLGIDLFGNPDLALDPVIGARLAVRGILDGRWNARGKGIKFYLRGPGADDDDLQGARRTVNVTDRWQTVAGYYRGYRAALLASGYGAAVPAPEEPPEWMAAARRLAEWRAREPAGALDWMKEMPT